MSEPVLLGRDEFVQRMLAFKAAQRRQKKPSCQKKPRKAGSGRPRPVVRDDGVRFATITEALVAAGYARTGCSNARARIDDGATWRDGHVYEWDDGGGDR